LGALEDRPKPFVIEESAVREPVNHRALEAELGGAFELVRRRCRIARWQRREGSEAFGVRSNNRMQPVVSASRQLDRVRAGKLLCRGRAVGEDLHVDAGLVHFAQAQLAEIVKPVEHVGSAHALSAGEAGRELLVPVVLLDGDDGTLWPLKHDACLPCMLAWLPGPHCGPQGFGTRRSPRRSKSCSMQPHKGCVNEPVQARGGRNPALLSRTGAPSS